MTVSTRLLIVIAAEMSETAESGSPSIVWEAV